MVDFTAHLGKYTKIKQLSRKISQFRQIFVFTAKFLSLPLGGAAKFFTASGNSIPPTFRYLAENSGHLVSLQCTVLHMLQLPATCLPLPLEKIFVEHTPISMTHFIQ